MAKYVHLNSMSIMNKHIGVDVTEEEFLDKFLDFIESNDWFCAGHSEECDDEDE